MPDDGSAVVDDELPVRDIADVHLADLFDGPSWALADAARPPDCLVCRHSHASELAAIDGLVRHVGDPAWATAAREAALCLAHLLELVRTISNTHDRRAIEAQQLERIAELHERLRAFTQHSSYDQRHLLSDGELRASDEAAMFLGAGSDGHHTRETR